jgi:small-conductance mechanosensitive channel
MKQLLDKQLWKAATTKFVPCGILCVIGATVANASSHHPHAPLHYILLRTVGIAIYVMFGISAVHILTTAFYKQSTRRIGVGRASTVRFILRIIGYIVLVLGFLSLLHIPVARLLFGGAVIGVILGVAAQQSLANFFASIVIIIDRPFVVGQEVTIVSGALGGPYTGTVADISFSHTRLRLEDGTSVDLPNATLFSGAAIKRLPKGTIPEPPKKQ